MRKDKLTEAVSTAKAETKNALQTVYDALNSGQKKENRQGRESKGFV